MGYCDRTEFSTLLGKTLASVTINDGKDRVEFVTIDGEKFVMLHNDNCCEMVGVEDVTGNLADLIGEPITLAEESTNSESHPEGYDVGTYAPESFTWTFYRIATRKGHVDIRWLGTSSGYYSERVDFERVTN